MTTVAATPEELRRAQRVAELRARLGNPQGFVHPHTPPTSPQSLEAATQPVRLLTEQHMRELTDQYRQVERAREPLLNRDDTLDQLRMIALHEQNVIRALGRRIASQAGYIRFVDPNSHSQWKDNQKVCNKLRDAEHPKYNCKTCRLETYEEWKLCHRYPLYESHPEVRKFLKR